MLSLLTKKQHKIFYISKINYKKSGIYFKKTRLKKSKKKNIDWCFFTYFWISVLIKGISLFLIYLSEKILKRFCVFKLTI